MARKAKPDIGAVPGWRERAQRVADAKTDDFVKLIRRSGLDPKRHLRFADWSGISFARCVLRGFDFTGARLNGCRFDGARLDGARFDQAEIAGANLQAARDWETYIANWGRVSHLAGDDHLPIGAVFQDAPFGPEMVVVPAGKFMMGSPEDEPWKPDGRRSLHEVTFTHPFAVGRDAVTHSQFAMFLGRTGYGPTVRRGHTGRDGNDPVVGISWRDAKAYASWLSRQTGKPYRLLREAEWEYVVHAGMTTPFWWEDTNPWGLHNLDGNVLEWCEDRWHDNHDGEDSAAWIEDVHGRMVRGGAWYYYPRDILSLRRNKFAVEFSLIGCRLARALTP